MPAYEYRCSKCKRETTIFNRTVAERDSLTTCHECGGPCERREVASTPPAVHFKGEGWTPKGK